MNELKQQYEDAKEVYINASIEQANALKNLLALQDKINDLMQDDKIDLTTAYVDNAQMNLNLVEEFSPIKPLPCEECGMLTTHSVNCSVTQNNWKNGKASNGGRLM